MMPSRLLRVGRGCRGAKIPPWILKLLAKKGCFFNFEGQKTNFTAFGLPLEKIFGKSPTAPPPWKKSFRRPCQQLKICSIFKERKCARKIFSYHTLRYIYCTLQFIVFATLSNLNKTSNLAVTHTSKMHENRCVLLKSDKHVRPMRFTVLCTPTDSSDKTQLKCSTILLCLFAPQSDSSATKLNYSTMSNNKIRFINF